MRNIIFMKYLSDQYFLSIPRSECLFTLQFSIFIPLFGDDINTTILQDRYKGTLFEGYCCNKIKTYKISMKKIYHNLTQHIQRKIMQRTKKLNVVFAIGAILVALYAILVYGILTEWVVPLGNTVDPDMKRQFNLQKPAIYIHALSSAIALAIGPFQVLAYFRSKYLEAHRWAGRAYVIFATIGSVTGVIVAQKAQGGISGVISFSILGVLWLISTLIGYVTIAFFKKIQIHELSMQISVALSYSAVSLRILLPIAVFTDFQLAYAIVSWLSWTINLLVLFILRQTLKVDQNLQSSERLQA